MRCNRQRGLRKCLDTVCLLRPFHRNSSSSPSTLSETVPACHGLSYYWDTTPPSPAQLRHAESIFKTGVPRIVDSAVKFRTVKQNTASEVAFLGRSNVGKSTLLNALMGRKLCHVSSQPGRTRSMNFFAIGGEDHIGAEGRISLLDMPGYGRGSREEWGGEIMKYLTQRKQLRRAFLLVNAEHGLKTTDLQLLSSFRRHGIAHQVILSKIDAVVSTQMKPDRCERLDRIVADIKSQIQPGLKDGPEALGELICCSGNAMNQGEKIGIDRLRYAIVSAVGLVAK